MPYNLNPHLYFEIWEPTKLKLMTSGQPGPVCGNGEVTTDHTCLPVVGSVKRIYFKSV